MSLAYALTRWNNVLMGMFFFTLRRRRPELVKKMVRKGLIKALGRGYDLDTHFKPRYNPWDQRMCLVPDADLFKSLKSGRASIVTDHVERFTENGIKLKSGHELQADLVVTATGLELQLLGGAELSVDGRAVDLSKTLNYKGMMCSGVPNMGFAIGYTNAAWTLKCDLTSAYMCRLLNYMDRMGYLQCTPHNSDPSVTEEPLIEFSSGYVQRAIDKFPKQGSKTPWRLHQNYVRDLLALRYGSVEDEAMEFSNPAPPIEPVRSAAAQCWHRRLKRGTLSPRIQHAISPGASHGRPRRRGLRGRQAAQYRNRAARGAARG